MPIYALSTGPGVSGVAVIRVSGKGTIEVIKKISGKTLPKPRLATIRKFYKSDAKYFSIPSKVSGDDVLI